MQDHTVDFVLIVNYTKHGLMFNSVQNEVRGVP